MSGVTMLNISRNLMSAWTDVEGILEVVSGVSTLIMKYVFLLHSLFKRVG